MKKNMKKVEKLSKVLFSTLLISTLLASNFLIFIPEAKACAEIVCPPGDIKYEIDEEIYEYTDGTATISGNATTIYWSATEGCTVTNVCIKIGGPGGGSLIHPDPSLGQWTTETYGISHIVISTNCEEPGPVCGNGIIEEGEYCDDGSNNGVECTPEYGSSCNYCSNQCEIVELQGPYCGDGNIDHPYEECETNTDCTCGKECVNCQCVSSPKPYCELELTKTDSPDPVEPGENILYHLTLENTGTADCTGTGVRIKDVFDQNTTYVSSSKTPEEVTATYVKWNVGTLHPGDIVEIDLTMLVLEDTPCETILENKAKYWSNQTNWGDFVIEETTVQCPPPPEYVNIYAHKIVCENEIDLPNWGDGGPHITATTAEYFVNNNQSCHLASGWDFEWAQSGVSNPGDNIIGPAGSGWTTFGPTDSNGLTSISIDNVSGDRLWLREVMQEGYFPFSGDTTAPRDNVSAEMYCHQDVLNYDNYDYVLNPQLGQNYYCVAFNVLATTTEPTSTLIVIDHVVGGTATSGDFTVNVTGTNPVPASFPGEESPGTTVILEPGVYSVTQSTLPNYITSYSSDCSSTIAAGETKTCTITNVYQEEPPSTSTLIVIDHVVGGTATSGNFTVYVSGNSPSTTSFPGEESPGTAVTINPGAYNVTQSTLPNYTTSYSENCSSTIAAGETKTCTITNTYQCVPIKPCSELGCNQTDSCGNYCGGCGGPSPYCGDGVVNSGEECDGKAGVTEGYTCTASCKLEKIGCQMDINVMMVLDVSGSMGYNTPTRLSQAKIAANSFLDNLRSSDQSGLVSFSWTAALNKKLSNDHASTKSAVNGLIASGATNIGDAIDKANKELISTVNPLTTAKIQIILTDGRANQPNGNGFEENPLDLALALDKSLEAAENGIMIFTVGLGPDINANMLRNIAQNTGGKYYFAPTSNDLTEIFNQIASETCKSTSTAYESPAITVFNAGVRSVSNTSVIVSWYTNIPATSRVVYGEQKISTPGIAPNYGYAFSTIEQDSINKVIFHSVTISGLTPNKTYYWRPISRGSPEVWGEELSFTTTIETPVIEETGEEEIEPIEEPIEIEEEVLPEFSERLDEEEAIAEDSQENQSFFAFLSNGVASIFNALKSLFGQKIFICSLLIIIIAFLVILLLKKRKREKEDAKLVTTLEQ